MHLIWKVFIRKLTCHYGFIEDDHITVLLKHNVALVREKAFAHSRIIANERDVVTVSLTNIHLTINSKNIRERNGCHTPSISDYSSASKCLLARECDIALERYHT